MGSKKIDMIWGISLFAIGITSMILVGADLVRIDLTDIVVRTCGAIDLIALPVFVFSTVRRVKSRK